MRSIAVISVVVSLASTQSLAMDTELESAFDDVLKSPDSFSRMSAAARSAAAHSAVRSSVFHSLTPELRVSYLISMTRDQRVRFIEAALGASTTPEESRQRVRASRIMPDILEGNTRFRQDLIDMIGVMHMEIDSKILAKTWKAEIKNNSAPKYSALMDQIDQYYTKNPPVKPPLSPRQIAALAEKSLAPQVAPPAPELPVTTLASVSTRTKPKLINPFEDEEDDDEGIIIFDEEPSSSGAMLASPSR